MAIVKQNVYHSNTLEAVRNVYNFLQEYAAEYFDEITFTDSSRKLICKKDDAELLQLNASGNFSITVNNKNNTVTVSLYPTGVTLYEAASCKGGIVMNLISGKTVHGFCLAVTKDNAGNTTVILQDSPVPSASDPVKIYVITPDTVSDAYTYIHRSETDAENNNAPITEGIPFVVHTADGNYTPDVLLAFYRQYTDKGILEIDGVKYLYNGIWCVRDE